MFKKKKSRVLLKLSGKAFAGKNLPISEDKIIFCVKQIVEAYNQGIQICILVGGGNFFQGKKKSPNSLISRITYDYMGMTSTLINGLALRDILKNYQIKSKIFSSISINGITEHFSSFIVEDYIIHGGIGIFVFGTGNPFFSTDTAASLRSIEINANVLLKATNVDGIYNKDPKKYNDAILFKNISFDTALKRNISVMDANAFSQCKDYNIPIVVFNFQKKMAIKRALLGEKEGTLVNFKGE